MRPRLLDLPHGHQTVIDEADMLLVEGLTLYRGTNGYVYFSTWENGKSTPRTLHGLLMEPAKGMHVDHINGDKLDNRRENLRVVTPSINGANRRQLNRNNTSGIRGVTYRPSLSRLRPWLAQITINHKNLYLGLHETKDAAIQARRDAELEHFGEVYS